MLGRPYKNYEKFSTWVVPYLKHNHIRCRRYAWLAMAGNIDIVKIDGKVRRFDIDTREELKC